jgi:hypothetical protein
MIFFAILLIAGEQGNQPRVLRAGLIGLMLAFSFNV